MRYFTILSLCIFISLSCNKEEEEVLAGDDTIFFCDDLGRGITERLMATRHAYDSLHNPVEDTASVIFYNEDSITPTELFPRRAARAYRNTSLQQHDNSPSYYYDYYKAEGNQSKKMLKLVTAVSTDTAYSLHRYAFASNSKIIADTTIAWNTFVVSIDTSITYYY